MPEQFHAGRLHRHAAAGTRRLGDHREQHQPGVIGTRFRRNAIQAGERRLDPGASRHREEYATHALFRGERGGLHASLPPTAVVRSIIRALEAARPRRRYVLTHDARMLLVLRRLLPEKWLDAILRRPDR